MTCLEQSTNRAEVVTQRKSVRSSMFLPYWSQCTEVQNRVWSILSISIPNPSPVDLSGSVDGVLKLQAPVTFRKSFASTNSGYNFGFIISAPKLNFCFRKLRRIVTNFIYLRTRVCIIDCTVIHVCRGLVQLKKVNSDQGG